jgi:hypothetical protein
MQSKLAMRPRSLLALAAALLLAACNASPSSVAVNTPPPAATDQQTGTAVPSFNLPAGTACSNDINSYETIASNDLDTGNVEQSVYDQIQVEMKSAAAACQAGRDAEARSIVADSKRKHGYS